MSKRTRWSATCRDGRRDSAVGVCEFCEIVEEELRCLSVRVCRPIESASAGTGLQEPLQFWEFCLSELLWCTGECCPLVLPFIDEIVFQVLVDDVELRDELRATAEDRLDGADDVF